MPKTYNLKPKTCILGIDPGLERTGWAVLEALGPAAKPAGNLGEREPRRVGSADNITNSFKPSQAIHTGFSELRYKNYSKPKIIGCGLIKTSAKLKMETRLLELNRQLLAVLKKYKPAKIIIEELFFSSNVKTALMVGQARGVILLSCAGFGAPIINITPTALKAALTGSGTASKTQIQKMLPLLCAMDKPVIQDDTADAIALAWYGCK